MSRALLVLCPIALLVGGCSRPGTPTDPPSLGWATEVSKRPAGWPRVPPGGPFLDIPWPMSPADALVVLSRSEHVVGSIAGDGGGPTAESVAFNVLADQPNAADFFRQLSTSTNPVGRFYAVCGLQLTDRVEYHRLRESLLKSDDDVETINGCIVLRQRVAKLVLGLEISNWGAGFRKDRERIYQELDRLANNPIKLSVRVVTPRAVARVAPTRPAAYRVR